MTVQGTERRDEQPGIQTEFDLRQFILVFKEGFPPGIAEHVLTEYVPAQDWTPAAVLAGTHPEIRNCDEISLSSPAVIGTSVNRRIILTQVSRCVAHVVHRYQQHFPKCWVSRVTGFQLLRYQQGGFYVEHHDDCHEFPRILTCLVILNDSFEGGAFSLLGGEVEIEAEANQVILFPSNFVYQHAAKPVTSGTRYVIVAWLS